MVKDHLSNNEFRDYAFVEYFSIEDATKALEQMKRTPMIIRGEALYAAFSKIKREEALTTQQVIFSFMFSFLFRFQKVTTSVQQISQMRRRRS